VVILLYMKGFIWELLLIVVLAVIPMSNGLRLTLDLLGNVVLHSTEAETQVVSETTEKPIPTYSLSPDDYIDSHSKTINLNRELLDIEFDEMLRLYEPYAKREREVFLRIAVFPDNITPYNY